MDDLTSRDLEAELKKALGSRASAYDDFQVPNPQGMTIVFADVVVPWLLEWIQNQDFLIAAPIMHLVERMAASEDEYVRDVFLASVLELMAEAPVELRDEFLRLAGQRTTAEYGRIYGSEVHRPE